MRLMNGIASSVGRVVSGACGVCAARVRLVWGCSHTRIARARHNYDDRMTLVHGHSTRS